MGSWECLERHLEAYYEVNGKIKQSSWSWPLEEPSEKEIKILMSLMLEISIKLLLFMHSYVLESQS